MITKELLNAKPLTGKERLGAFRNSEYMGAEDIEDGTEPILTIKALYNANITLARGKERHDVIVFEEESVPGSINVVRPLVVNATNRKTLRKIYRNVTADTLVGKKIQLYIEHGVRDPSSGDKVDGIRIRPKVPTPPRTEPIICTDCGGEVTGISRFSAAEVAQINQKRFGVVLCADCSKKRQAAAEAAQNANQETSADTDADETENNEQGE